MSSNFCSESDDSSDDDNSCEQYVWLMQKKSNSQLYAPHDRNQGFFLANLAKILDESEQINLSLFLRWAPCCKNALQINWPGLIQSYPEIHNVLVDYKMVRKSNSVLSARSSWNRKLREWNFTMQPPEVGDCWTTYTYASSIFRRGCRYELLPNKRR